MSAEMYCVKCKKKTPTKGIHMSRSKNGKPMTRGTCAVCGTTKVRFGAAGHKSGGGGALVAKGGHLGHTIQKGVQKGVQWVKNMYHKHSGKQALGDALHEIKHQHERQQARQTGGITPVKKTRFGGMIAGYGVRHRNPGRKMGRLVHGNGLFPPGY